MLQRIGKVTYDHGLILWSLLIILGAAGIMVTALPAGAVEVTELSPNREISELAVPGESTTAPVELAELQSLADILPVAMDNSPSLKIAEFELQEALAGRQQVGAALKPQLSIAGQHKVENAANNSSAIKQLLAGVMEPDERLNTTMGSLTWYQQLGPNAQLKGAIQQGETGHEISLLRREQALKELITSAQAGYHGVLRAYNGLNLARQARDHAGLNLQAAEDQLRLGTATPLDVLREKNAYLESEQTRQAAQMGVEMAVLALLQRMGLTSVDTDTALGWAKQLSQSNEMVVQPWTVDLDTAFMYMLEHRPELAMVRKQQALAEISYDQTKAERDWTVKLSGQYLPNDKTVLQSSLDSNRTLVSTVARTEMRGLPDLPGPSGESVDPWQVDLSATYRFGDGGAKKAQLAAKEAALEKAKLQVAMAQDGFYLELNGALQQLDQTWRAYLLALEGEQAAQETLAQLELLYKLGSLTSKEVREGQLMVAQAKNRVLDSVLTYEAQKSKVAVAMGIDGEILAQAVAKN